MIGVYVGIWVAAVGFAAPAVQHPLRTFRAPVDTRIHAAQTQRLVVAEQTVDHAWYLNAVVTTLRGAGRQTGVIIIVEISSDAAAAKGLIIAGITIIDTSPAGATLIEILELTLWGAVEDAAVVEYVHGEVGIAGDAGAVGVALAAWVGWPLPARHVVADRTLVNHYPFFWVGAHVEVAHLVVDAAVRRDQPWKLQADGVDVELVLVGGDHDDQDVAGWLAGHGAADQRAADFAAGAAVGVRPELQQQVVSCDQGIPECERELNGVAVVAVVPVGQRERPCDEIGQRDEKSCVAGAHLTSVFVEALEVPGRGKSEFARGFEGAHW